MAIGARRLDVLLQFLTEAVLSAGGTSEASAETHRNHTSSAPDDALQNEQSRHEINRAVRFG
jgi:hypothetical protein